MVKDTGTGLLPGFEPVGKENSTALSHSSDTTRVAYFSRPLQISERKRQQLLCVAEQRYWTTDELTVWVRKLYRKDSIADLSPAEVKRLLHLVLSIPPRQRSGVTRLRV
jgi:hypothetical protein